ncbi:MAG: helicase-exonuclease AddAB subunit AddB [Eubacteriales bacterium]|nr:helicase-exonuclease AddAB subunit AddB [Eubacteriales bacterium]
MSLQLILGNSGSGKSYELYQRVISAAVKSPEKKFLVIVPEQFTMQTQRELVRLHPDGGLLNIDILSFQRLAHRVFEEVGADRRTVLEETGKTLLLRRAASRRQENLKVLKGNLKKMGYLQQMKSMISELTQYDVDEEKMQRLLDGAKGKPSLYFKLQDIRQVYEGFREEMQGKYITAEETLEALCQVAGRSAVLRGSVIALDGFTGFTPSQQKLLGELLPMAEQVYAAVTIDAGEDFFRIRGEHELFYMSKKMIRILMETAREKGCSILPPVVMEWKTLPRFAKSPELAFLEAHLFRSGRRGAFWMDGNENGRPADTSAPKEKETSLEKFGVSMHRSANPAEEIHFAARQIRRLLRQGYRYQDMAVIVGDLPSYSSYIPKIFAEYGIPCFLDNTRSLFSNPMIEFMRAALDMVQQNFTGTSVFRCLRTGLCQMEREQIDLLENYVLAAGIRGLSQWEKEFERCPQSFSTQDLERCNELRAQAASAFSPFAAAMKSRETSVREKTKAFYRLIVHFGMQKQLAVKAEEFGQIGRADIQREYAGVYRMIMELFDKLTELLGGEKLSLKEYTEILEAAFEEAKLGMIPPTADRIQVGDIERTRLKEIRVLFFLGLNDGWVPAAAGGTGLLSDMERESLRDCGVELAPTARQNSYIQKFYLYMNLTKPGEHLYLSFCKTNSEGSPMRPSYVIAAVRKCFPFLEIQEEDDREDIAGRVETQENGMIYLAEGFQKIRREQPKPQWLELYRRYLWTGGRSQVETLAQAAFLTFDGKGIGREKAKELYGSTLVNSVSRLEKFASCAFAHFLQYGLRLKEREEYLFQPVDMGRMLHGVMEEFSKKMLEDGNDWASMPAEERDRMVEACVDEAAAGYGQQILFDSARNRHMIDRIKRIMRRTAWALQRQIQAGKFYPANFEVPFSQAEDLEAVHIALSGEERMKLTGRIDRIDVCEKEECVYVKVIDYKSGNTSFDLTAFYYGLQLQLAVYLNAAIELEQRVHPGKKILPAGIFYCHMKDPLLKMDSETEEDELERKLLREFRPDGLVNSEPEVFRQMDGDFSKSSEVIPVTLNKDGTLAKASRTATEQQFGLLSSYVRRKMGEIAERIMQGEIAAVPYQRKQQTACDYCAYRRVCCPDPKIPGTHYRRLREYTQEEIWKLMEEGGDSDGSDMDEGTAAGH